METAGEFFKCGLVGVSADNVRPGVAGTILKLINALEVLQLYFLSHSHERAVAKHVIPVFLLFFVGLVRARMVPGMVRTNQVYEPYHHALRHHRSVKLRVTHTNRN